MSIAGDRQEIADALSTVEGVRGFKYRPDTLRKGHAWPLLDVLEAAARDFEATWRIFVVMPSDEEKASEWFDEMYEPIAEALESVGIVEQIYPEGMRTSSGDIQVMHLILRKEG